MPVFNKTSKFSQAHVAASEIELLTLLRQLVHAIREFDGVPAGDVIELMVPHIRQVNMDMMARVEFTIEQALDQEREACAQLCDHRKRLQLTRAAAELNEHARERAAEAAGCAQDIRNRRRAASAGGC